MTMEPVNLTEETLAKIKVSVELKKTISILQRAEKAMETVKWV